MIVSFVNGSVTARLPILPADTTVWGFNMYSHCSQLISRIATISGHLIYPVYVYDNVHNVP